MKNFKSSEENRIVCLVCALECEAEPLIRHFGLKSEGGGGRFRVYRNESLHLVLTGVGKKTSEAGTRFLGDRTIGDFPIIWVNIGIAGHPTRTIGEAVIAGKILDRKTRKTWYPPLAFSPKLPTDLVITVEKPAGLDGGEALYDMEAAGFYPAALRYSTSELVHCLKIVSDNRESPAAEIRPARVRQWVLEALPEIEEVLGRLGDLAAKGFPPTVKPALIKNALARWHFSGYQKNELASLFRRIQALNLEGMIQIEGQTKVKNSREFLSGMRDLIAGCYPASRGESKSSAGGRRGSGSPASSK